MKEKRIDIYLALASFYQLMLLGFGGAFLNEIIQEKPRMIIAFPAGFMAMIFGAGVIHMFLKARAMSRKSKKTNL